MPSKEQYSALAYFGFYPSSEPKSPSISEEGKEDDSQNLAEDARKRAAETLSIPEIKIV